MINTLIFSGGGINGFYFVGALDKLIEKNIIDFKNVKYLLGCSVGSIISLFINLNYSIHFIKKLCLKLNLLNLLEIEEDIITPIDLLNYNGLFYIDTIKTLLENLLYEKYKIKQITFKDLYDKTNIELTIKVFNYTKNKEEHINYINYPDYSVIDIICASCSIPFIFKMYKYNKNYYLDGGIVEKVPDYSDEKYKDNIMLCTIDNTKTMNNSDNFIGYINDIIEIITKKERIKNKNTLLIPVSNDSGFNFNISEESKLEMINLSKIFTEKHIETYFKSDDN